MLCVTSEEVAFSRKFAGASSAASGAPGWPEGWSSVDEGGNRKIGRVEVAREFSVGEGGLEVIVPVDTYPSGFCESGGACTGFLSIELGAWPALTMVLDSTEVFASCG